MKALLHPSFRRRLAPGLILSGMILLSGAFAAIEPPVIDQQPRGGTFPEGLTLAISVTAHGAGELSYQWIKNGVAIEGETNRTFVRTPAMTSHDGAYRVRVSNAGGEILSEEVSIVVSSSVSVPPPVIITHPTNTLALQGSTIALRVEAANHGYMIYKWVRAPVTVVGDRESLTFSPVQPGDAGTYFVEVKNQSGDSTFSDLVTLTVIPTPVIGSQPAVAVVGAPLVLSVQSLGADPIGFRWLKNGAAIPGATAQGYSIPAAAESDNGAYTVEVTYGAGVISSAPFELRVYIPPTIIQAPRPVAVPLNQTATLSVQASGTALEYQWFRNGLTIAGATTSTLTIPNAQYSDSGDYAVLVRNPAAAITTTPVALAVGGPRILLPLASPVVEQGATFSMQVEIDGESPFTYQWYKDGKELPGKTSAILIITSAQATDAGFYTIKITNPRGTTISEPGLVQVKAAPVIVTQPAATTVNQGSPAAITVGIAGSGPFTFQWFKNGQLVPGQTSQTLAIASAQVSDAGSYTVTVSNPYGSVTSGPALLTITGAPRITQHPNGLTVRLGAGFTLTVLASGDGTLRYQWLKDDQELSGATSASFSIASAALADSGVYRVRVSNASGSVLSSGAEVRVLIPPTILTGPASGTVNEGASLSLSVQAGGSPPFQYQWLRNGSEIPGATAATLTIASAKPSDEGNYSVRVSNPVGSATSSAAVITIFGKPLITAQPASKTTTLASFVLFSVGASGSGTLTYQWFRNGQAIPNATSAALVISSVKESDLGTYTVRVSNAAGFTESNPATLALIGDPDQIAGRLSISRAGTEVKITAKGIPGTAYQVQTSANLNTWITLQSVVPDATGTFEITAPSPSLNRVLFIRTVR